MSPLIGRWHPSSPSPSLSPISQNSEEPQVPAVITQTKRGGGMKAPSGSRLWLWRGCSSRPTALSRQQGPPVLFFTFSLSKTLTLARDFADFLPFPPAAFVLHPHGTALLCQRRCGPLLSLFSSFFSFNYHPV